MWKHWVNVALGLLVAVMPWLGLTANVHQWTMVVVGLAIAGVAASFVMENKGGGTSM